MTTPDKEEMPRTAGNFWAEKRDGRWQLQMRHRGPGSSFCVAQINHWADNPEALTTRIADACNAYEPMREALNALRVDRDYWNADARRLSAGLLAIHRADESVPASVLRGIAYDISLNCITQDVAEFQIEERSRAALSTLHVNDRQTSDDVGILRALLEEELVWHEERDKSLSKQPQSNQVVWRRAEHQERIDVIRAALKGPASEAEVL